MTAESPSPTLTDLQNKWDADFSTSYRKHLRLAAIAALFYLPVCLWWLYGIVGWPLTVASAVIQLVAIPNLARLHAKLSMGRRPTEQSFAENRRIRENDSAQATKLVVGTDDASEA